MSSFIPQGLFINGNELIAQISFPYGAYDKGLTT